MGHELARKNDMIYVGETPWHKLGIRCASAPTIAEAMRLARLDWTVSTQPIAVTVGDPPVVVRTIKSHCAVVRSDTGAVLGVVGAKWTPVQNADTFGALAPFVDAGLVSIETAGKLFDGRRVWALGRIKRPSIDVGGGDIVEKYVLAANGHDGSLALRFGLTPIRVVCNNTLSMAIGAKSGSQLIRFRHTSGAAAALKDVAERLDIIDAQFTATAEQYQALARKQVNAADLKAYFRVVFPSAAKPKAPEAPKSQPRPVADVRVSRGETPLVDAILAETPDPNVSLGDIADETTEQQDARCISILEGLFENGPGAQLKSARGTAWGAYNTITRYVTHERGRNDETRAAGLMSGSGALIAQRALAAATKLLA